MIDRCEMGGEGWGGSKVVPKGPTPLGLRQAVATTNLLNPKPQLLAHSR